MTKSNMGPDNKQEWIDRLIKGDTLYARDHYEQELIQIWNTSGTLSEWREHDVNNGLKQVLRSTTSYKKLYSLISVAAGFLVIGMCLHFLYSGSGITTANNTIALFDGSIITLDADASLQNTESFGKEHRIVEFSGKAHFEVKPGKDLPFIVNGKDYQVKVIGTAFTIIEEETSLNIHVLHGEVEVTLNGKKYALKDRQTLYKSDDQINIVSNDTIQYFLFDKTFHFENQQLSEILETLSDAFRININTTKRTKNQSESCLINAKFESQNLYEILEELGLIGGIKFRYDKNNILVERINCQ